MPGPNFSPYPFERLRRTTRADAAFESALAQHVAARPGGFAKLEKLVGPVGVRIVGTTTALDPHAALADVRIAGHTIRVAAPGMPVRMLAQRKLGGPAELAAPRPLNAVETGVWCLVVAAALADLGIDGHVWPVLGDEAAPPALASTIAAAPARRTKPADTVAIELAVTLGDLALVVVAQVPRALELRVPARGMPTSARHGPMSWRFELPLVVARAAIARAALATLGIGDIVTVEAAFDRPRGLALEVGDAAIGLVTQAPNAVEATVATGYVPRDMALPDDAHLELSVQLGTTRLSLRQLSELAVGQIVSLGRPLAGPFEVRAAGRLLGHGELIDIDGELGVRIVSLAQE